jgi:hypothetical protein
MFYEKKKALESQATRYFRHTQVLKKYKPSPTFQITPEHLPNQQLLALSRVELFYLLNSPRRGVKKNGTF